MSLLRIAAIDFLNPAPLMWNFEHPPEAPRLASSYAIEKMTPAQCAQQLRNGEADLGLIPIAEYATIPGLAIVPGCAIASLGAIRSILLVVRGAGEGADAAVPRVPAVPPRSLLIRHTAIRDSPTEPDALTPTVLDALRRVERVAVDTASRTSAMYTRILFRKYWDRDPQFLPQAASLEAMLGMADAALLIGDPALFALEDRASRAQRTGEHLHYLDLGSAWRAMTGLPWVSAFWAVRTGALGSAGLSPSQDAVAQAIAGDCAASRDAGLAHLGALGFEWSARLGLPISTVETYLGQNIHYHLDEACLRGIDGFYADAEECELIPRKPPLIFL